MVLADRIRLANTRQLLRAFGGLNETYGCSEAEYSAGVNFSTRDFPALSTRTPRRKLRALTGLNGMYHLNGLLTVCGRDITYTPDDAAAPAVTKPDAVTDGRKALVGIGTKILIFPDKVAFDTADGSVTALGALWTAAGKSVTFAPCDAAGKTYQVEAFGREEPAEPADGQLFLKVEDADHPWRYDSTLEMYSKNSGSWAAIPLEYCRITAAGLGKLFRQWDTVTVQGAAAEAAGQSPELNGDQIVYDVGEDWLRVRCTPQGEYFYGTLVQNAAAAQWQSMDGKQHRSVEAAQTVSMERRVPELDFVTECDNRVWGCNSRENVIYGCKLGDPTNWFSYRGIAADSYDDIVAYADDLFDAYGYGTGENKDGILLVVAMEERKWAISTHGLAIQYVTDKGNEYLQEQFLPYLSDGDYAKAFLAYAKGCDYLYAERTGQKPSDYFNQSDSYDGDQDFYDDDYDSYEPVSVGRRLEITARYIPIALLVGFLLSMIPMGIMKAKLRTVQQKSGAADYVDRDSLRITDTRDIFLYRTVNRTKRAQENEDHDGPSTTHTSSSGETHGGSSGSF